MFVSLMNTASMAQQAPEGTTEEIIPRKGNRLPVRIVRTVDVTADFEETVSYERDPLTKRGRRRVVVQRIHPKFTGVWGAFALTQRRIYDGFYKQTEKWTFRPAREMMTGVPE